MKNGICDQPMRIDNDVSLLPKNTFIPNQDRGIMSSFMRPITDMWASH